MLVLEVNLKRYRRGPGVWRFKNSLLTNETFLRKVIEEIGCAKQEEGIYRNTQDLGLRIEILLANICVTCIAMGKEMAKNRCKKEKKLFTDIVKVIIKMQQGYDGQSEYECYEAQSEALQEEKAKRAMLLSRTRWCELGEKPTAYFLKLHLLSSAQTAVSRAAGCPDKLRPLYSGSANLPICLLWENRTEGRYLLDRLYIRNGHLPRNCTRLPSRVRHSDGRKCRRKLLSTSSKIALM